MLKNLTEVFLHIFILQWKQNFCFYFIFKFFLPTWDNLDMEIFVNEAPTAIHKIYTIIWMHMYMHNVFFNTISLDLKLKSKFGELQSPARQQIVPWSRAKVKAKVTSWCQLKGLVTRTMHAKYLSSIINTLEDMSQVFVIDRWTNEFNCPLLLLKHAGQ